jgi:5-methylcytosine-specific restriction endonuclease McrA
MPVGTPVTRRCGDCGQDFTYPSKVGYQRSYCDDCLTPEGKRRIVRQAIYARYRARKNAGVVEEFDHQDIFERDGWTCGICHEPTLRPGSWPHPLSPTLDHAVPLAKGGDHTRANVQCAHLTCNASKGARVEQLTG